MESLNTIAYTKIRDLISSGDLREGERLVEKRVSDMIGVGRTPIREAFRRLEAEGYLSFLPNSGVVVKKISLSELRETYDLIAVLEGYATEVATKYIKTADKTNLTAMKEILKKAARNNDYKLWIEKNAELHSYFVKLSGNALLAGMVSQLRRKAARYRYVAAIVPGSLEKYSLAHEEVLKAALNKEPKKAGNRMRKHILDASEKLFNFIMETGSSQESVD